MTDPPAPAPVPDEIGELLSALVDGEVTEAERAEAATWLERSAAARTEYDELARVKALLRGLPAVEAPPGFSERLVRQPVQVGPGRRWGRPRREGDDRSWAGSPAALVASLVATAAAWLLLGGAGRADQLVPPIEDVQVSALAGGDPVALLRQEGEVDWDELPGGVRSDIGDVEVWVASGDGPATVIAERDGAVYTLVSAEVTAVALVAMVDELPAGEADSTVDDLVDRARDACHTLVATLTWG